jgi:hypothetical protein
MSVLVHGKDCRTNLDGPIIGRIDTSTAGFKLLPTGRVSSGVETNQLLIF